MNQSKRHKQTRHLAITTYVLGMGGVSNFILELGKFLKAKGYDVTIICTDRKGDWFNRIGPAELKGSYFVSGFWEWVPFGRILHARRIGRYMRKREFDFIINNHSFYIHAAAGYFYDRSRIIHVVHNQLQQMVELEADPMSDMLVGVSPRIGELALGYLDMKKVLSILNGIRLPVEASQEFASCSLRPMDLLYVGRMDNRQKAVFLIPDIISYLLGKGVRTRITMVGDGPDLEELKQKVSDKGLSAYIDFTGKVDPEQVGSYYDTHKILLLPSNFEGHPLTLMEGMARGCVPVASLLPLCTDICIEQGSSGYLVEMGKVSGFAEHIMELLGSEKLLDDLSMAAAERARDQFSVEKTHQKYLDLLRSFEAGKIERTGSTLLNRKYLNWKELVPFRLVIFIKRKVLKTL